MDSCILSSANLDKGMDSVFHDSEYEEFYGKVRIQPFIIRLAGDLIAAQAGNLFLGILLESKQLNFNLLKSTFLVMGDHDNSMTNKLKESPLKLCGEPMKQEKQLTYLGEEISSGGVGASAEATVNKRSGKVKQLI